MAGEYPYGRFQIGWTWNPRRWQSTFEDGGLRAPWGPLLVYRWIWICGPLDIRRWRPLSEAERVTAEQGRY